MPELNLEPIQFSANRKAVAVFSSSDVAAAEIQSKLELSPYKAVILVFGSASTIEDKVKPRLAQLCRRGIASAAAEAEAVILDRGTTTGVAMLMGEGVASRSAKVSLIGVAPAGKVTYPGSKVAEGDQLEPNHSHFVLVEGNEWGTETTTLFRLTDALMQASARPASTEQNVPGAASKSPVSAGEKPRSPAHPPRKNRHRP